MRVHELLTSFAEIPRPLETDALCIRPLAANVFLAVRADGRLALFFQMPVTAEESSRQISNCMDAVVSDDFHVLIDGKPGAANVAGVALLLNESSLNDNFAAVTGHVFSILQRDPQAFGGLAAVNTLRIPADRDRRFRFGVTEDSELA
jgi:hypothetical protein